MTTIWCLCPVFKVLSSQTEPVKDKEQHKHRHFVYIHLRSRQKAAIILAGASFLLSNSSNIVFIPPTSIKFLEQPFKSSQQPPKLNSTHPSTTVNNHPNTSYFKGKNLNFRRPLKSKTFLQQKDLLKQQKDH